MGKITAVIGSVFIVLLCTYSYFPLSQLFSIDEFLALAFGPVIAVFLPLFLTVIAISSALAVAYVWVKGGFASQASKH